MCGIAGIISKNPKEADLQKMLRKQAHRGPDHTGSFMDKGFAGIGHNRLSIIDLSPAANEPFPDNKGRYYLTFNGEIYNYPELKNELTGFYDFKTSSDTEVLLAAFLKWGRDCLHRLNGMFAFAVWDTQEKKLFAARDRFGVKPFYYTTEKDAFYFGSEIKTLQAVVDRKEPNEKVWANYFCYGSYGMPGETFYKDLQQLPGGHFLEFGSGKLSVEKWYDFPARVAAVKKDLSFEEAKAHYFQLLKDSIKLRFRADVPVAFNISGGVDSSLLLALVNLFEDKKNINAYTFHTGDKRYDELPWVEKMIATTRNPLTKVNFSASEVKNTAAFISVIQDEPFGGIPSLAYSKIFKQAQQDGIKVLLDGQGMDEQWAGYDYYLQEGHHTIQGLGKKSAFKKNALKKDFANLAKKPFFPAPFDNSLQNKQYRDLFFTKIPRALRFNDRISMAYSTELREPFLDHRLVEFAFAQTREFKINHGVQKYMLREILKPLVPKELTTGPKRALQTPQREWLGEELREFTASHLKDLAESPVSHWFNHEEIHKELMEYLNGDQHSAFHLWQWINVELLLKKQ